MINNPLVNLILCQYTDKKINLKVVFDVGVSEYFFYQNPSSHTRRSTHVNIYAIAAKQSRAFWQSQITQSPHYVELWQKPYLSSLGSLFTSGKHTFISHIDFVQLPKTCLICFPATEILRERQDSENGQGEYVLMECV